MPCGTSLVYMAPERAAGFGPASAGEGPMLEALAGGEIRRTIRLICQTGPVGGHIDVEACTRRGIAVAEGVGDPTAPAELTWALVMSAMRRLPQYIGNLKHGAWQQSGLKSASIPTNFGLGMVRAGKALGIRG